MSGGGTTEIAVIALSGVVTADSIRIAGDEMDLSITEWMRKKYNLLIGPRNAEQLKFSIGSAMPLDPEEEAPVKGRDLVAAIPKTLMVDSREIREALSDPVDQIVAGVRRALERTPPELAADILDRGMVLSGGGGKPMTDGQVITAKDIEAMIQAQGLVDELLKRLIDCDGRLQQSASRRQPCLRKQLWGLCRCWQ